MKTSHVSFCLLLVATFLLTASGCGGSGGPTEKVTGKVTFKDGSTVSGGMIVFSDLVENSSSVGYIKEDGTYTLGTFDEADGAPIGKYKVTIVGNSEYGEKSAIATRFGEQGQTPLKAEVKAEENTINFEVERSR
ncbi:hypothetical protein DTL42_16745 [Bremerella cremea]|uniref:Carboxypeptidase regulatory-like domain-containing protein n=1 Tax=Bremerella cremea TaxID=1031537 RepID=A0A368KP25_9BACT|nr:hypothetical protein [Bremerella cremea]RCS46130.1 hypothetical protein DTL42_16745 [Bremerella cremea]